MGFSPTISPAFEAVYIFVITAAIGEVRYSGKTGQREKGCLHFIAGVGQWQRG